MTYFDERYRCCGCCDLHDDYHEGSYTNDHEEPCDLHQLHDVE